MKLSTRLEQIKRQKQVSRPPQPKPRPVRPAARKWTRKHWALAGLWLLLAAGGAWAALELVVWNKLPRASMSPLASGDSGLCTLE